MQGAYEKQKHSAAALASIAFIISAIYLFISKGGFGSLFSLKALAFVFVGMFAAALVIGMPAYYFQRGIAKILMKTISDPFSTKAVCTMQGIGVVIMITQVAVVFLVTKVAHQWLMI
jgi:hypothetical protein